MSIYDAAMRYKADHVPLIIIAGKEYGTGSSRDWAAKGTMLLGVRAVIAQSYERIHRSNLIGMGVLPLQFSDGQSASSLGLTGHERFEISGFDVGGAAPATVVATSADGSSDPFRGARAHRHAQGARILPARRHTALRVAPVGRPDSCRLIRRAAADWRYSISTAPSRAMTRCWGSC